MENFAKEIRYALRNLRKSPGFTLIAVATLALGIGANVAIFTVAKNVLLDPLPYPESERLMIVQEANPSAGFPRFSVAPLNYLDFHDRNSTFESMAAVDGASFAMTSPDGQPQRLRGLQVTGEYFDVYGVQPAHGRFFTPEHDRFGAERVAVLTYSFWQSRFGGDRQILERSLTLDGESYRVLGVMPEGILTTRDVVVPMAIDYQETARGAHYWGIRGRLAEGVNLEQARADLVQVAAQLEQAYPDSNTGWTAIVEPLHERIVQGFGSIMWMLTAAVGLVLLIAAGNVANLLLSRIAARERETAVRTALGASRWHLVRQFLTETTLLALLGGGLGVLLARYGTEILVAMSANAIPRSREVAVDGGVMLFALGLSLVTGLAFGLIPALSASRTDLGGTLKEGGRGQMGGRGGSRLRRGLVLAEVALSVLLLVGAGLLIKSLSRLLDVDPGFQPAGVMTTQLDLPETRYAEETAQSAFYRRMIDRVEALPGVESVAAVMPMPLTGSGFVLRFHVEGREIPEPNKAPSSNIRVVTESYFDAMRIPRMAGRVFERADDADAPGVIVLNETAVAKFFPGQDALGQRITFDDPRAEDVSWMTVVGVVADVHHEDLAVAPDPEMYWSFAQQPMSSATLIARTASDPILLTQPLRDAAAEIDRELPLYNFQSLEQIVTDSVAQPHFNSWLLGLFSGLALLLATLGVYGVISYSVTQGLREIGVRLALGAERSRILGLVLSRGLTLVGAGLAVGLVAAFFASRLLSTMVFDVSPTDLATYVTVALLLVAAGAAACLIPALRAVRVDPVVVLREE